ncbi:MAG: ECF-type sigma factor [Planctomycetota bacterium]
MPPPAREARGSTPSQLRPPTPEFAVEVAESCRRRLASLGDEELVKVATMRLEGYTTQEIAERLNCSPRTVERRLEAIRRAWADRDPDN